MLEGGEIFFKNVEILDVVGVFTQETRRVIEQDDGQGILSGAESESDAKGFNRTVTLSRILANHRHDAGSHSPPFTSRLIERDKPVATVDHVGEDHEPAQGDVFPEIVRGDTVLLAAIGTDEKLGSR